MTHKERRGFTITEIAVGVILLLLMLLFLLPVVQRNREAANAGRNATVAAKLREVETAKQLYVADKNKQTGDKVTLRDLLANGYLGRDPHEETGIFFDPGPVGSSPTFTIDPKHFHK